MNLKITFVGTVHPFRGGLAAFNERLGKELLKNGHSFHAHTFKLQYPGFLFPGKSQYATWEAPEDIEITVSVNSINPFNWIKTGNKIKREKPDILIFKYWLPFMGPCFGTIARKAKKNKKTKVITIVDNIIPHELRPGDKAFTKYFVKPVDAFIAMSKSVYNDLDHFIGNKPKALYPHPLFDNFGTPLSKQEAQDRLKLEANHKYILFFGLIRNYKGLDLLLEAMTDSQIKEKNIKLIVAGEFYENSKPYFDLIEKHHLSESIILHDFFIPDAEVANYFCASDLIVQPYKHATQSGVTQIGYHFDKPMLVTNVGGLSEIIPDGKVGYVVEPKPEFIAKAINDFYDNNREKQFIQNIAEEKQKYSWDGMVKTIINLYEKVNNHDNKK